MKRTECENRGRITALYNTGYFGGAIPAAGISLATERLKTDWSWRIPIIIQSIPALLVLSTVFLLPESPRWLYLHHREDEAFALLAKYHGNGDPGNPIVRLEVEEFRENIRQDASDKRWWDFRSVKATFFLFVFRGFFIHSLDLEILLRLITRVGAL